MLMTMQPMMSSLRTKQIGFMSQARIGQPQIKASSILFNSSPKVGFSPFVLILGSATFYKMYRAEVV